VACVTVCARQLQYIYQYIRILLNIFEIEAKMVPQSTFGIGDVRRPFVISPRLQQDEHGKPIRLSRTEHYLKVIALTLFKSNESSAWLASTRSTDPRKPANAFISLFMILQYF
jgi:hypothetical protein